MAGFTRLGRLRQATPLLFASAIILWIWIYSRSEVNGMERGMPIWHRPTKMVSVCEQYSMTAVRKNILIWNMPFRDIAMVPENLFTGQLLKDLRRISWTSSECGNCQITYDRDQFNVSDAVVYHGIYSNDSGLEQVERLKGQKYIWWSQESLLNAMFDNSTVIDFNWTMTPSRDSDIFSPYATFPWILKFLWLKEHGRDVMAEFCEMKNSWVTEKDELDEVLEEHFGDVKKKKRRKKQHKLARVEELLAKKMKLSIWISSNCAHTTTINRLFLVDKMESYGISVAKYGSCNGENLHISRWDPAFFEIISRYKFYLSFENSLHCKDYITEKLWFNALYSGAVPVIWGPHRDDVKAALPPKSYVFVEDFPTIKDLVKYLKYLNRNETAYSEYLEWRSWVKYLNKLGLYDPIESRYRGKSSQPNRHTRKLLDKYAAMYPVGFCKLCRELHAPDFCRKSKKVDILLSERKECVDEDLASEIVSKFGI